MPLTLKRLKRGCTPTGEVLTSGVPKEVAEIEALGLPIVARVPVPYNALPSDEPVRRAVASR